MGIEPKTASVGVVIGFSLVIDIAASKATDFSVTGPAGSVPEVIMTLGADDVGADFSTSLVLVLIFVSVAVTGTTGSTICKILFTLLCCLSRLDLISAVSALF